MLILALKVLYCLIRIEWNVSVRFAVGIPRLCRWLDGVCGSHLRIVWLMTRALNIYCLKDRVCSPKGTAVWLSALCYIQLLNDKPDATYPTRTIIVASSSSSSSLPYHALCYPFQSFLNVVDVSSWPSNLNFQFTTSRNSKTSHFVIIIRKDG